MRGALSLGYRVFLSHNAKDGNWIQWIWDNCRAIGIDAYLYEHDPKPGRLLGEKVQEAIRECNALVVLLTANSQYSPYVQQEVGFAKGIGKPVIPLVDPGLDQHALAMLDGVEFITFDYENPQLGLAILLEYLQKAKLGEQETQALVAVGALVETATHTKLGPIETEILRLTPDDGRIIILDFQLGQCLLLGPNSIPDPNNYDAERAAQALDGLETLTRRRLVRFEGGHLYRLTGRGFDVRKHFLGGAKVG